jgi:basic membrane lipoprotein Med (substrate-binding protein (PBP1-ABC) superfamily)
MRDLAGRAKSPPRFVLFVVVAALAGCGTTHVVTTTVATTHAVPVPPPSGLHIGVVGDVPAPPVAGALYEHGTVAQVGDDALVLVAAETNAAANIAAIAAAHPSTHFALVGSHTPDTKLRNVAGLVLRDDEAAHLAGIVAGVVAADEGVQEPRVGWAGPEQPALADAFGRGVHEVDARAQILHSWSSSVPAACQEAALAIVQRGAVAVLAPHGTCAEAAALGAHDQNIVALSLDAFENLAVPAAQVVADAVAGVYHGREDILFGAKSGAIAIGQLDPRITTDEAIRARTLSAHLER